MTSSPLLLAGFVLVCLVGVFGVPCSTQEQLFIAGGGLLPHLIKEITSDGMWCAGSLQTAFDLLGELCKGNRDVSPTYRMSVSLSPDLCLLFVFFSVAEVGLKPGRDMEFHALCWSCSKYPTRTEMSPRL